MINIGIQLSQIRSYLCDIKIGSESGDSTEDLSQITSPEQKSIALNIKLESGKKDLNYFSKTKDVKPKVDNLIKHLHLLD